jgi:hypothetical protein
VLVTGLSLTQFRDIVREVSESRYEGNVIVQADAYELSGNRFRGRLRCTTGRGAGARTSWRGAHYPIACWHAYRDVLAEVFRQFPDARVQSGYHFSVVYRGADDFAAKYPQTGRKNIGSQMEPVTMPELCGCEHNEPYAVIEPDPAAVALMNRLNGYPACGLDGCDCGDIPGTGRLDAESGGRTYAGRLDTAPYETSDGDPQGPPDTDSLLDRISCLLNGDPWNPAHP